MPRWVDNIKTDLKETMCVYVDRIYFELVWGAFVHGTFLVFGGFHEEPSDS